MWKKAIEQYIETHKEEMVEDIFRLCRINSEKMPAEEGKPQGAGVASALKVASEMAVAYGFAVKEYDGYAVAVDLNDNDPQLDILTHLDVVPAGDGWSVTEPFCPILKDGKVYGRGSADNKGPLVAALYAFRAVKELQIPLSKRCRLLLGTDEESGFSDIEYYYTKENEAPMTFAPDLCFPVVNMEKGPAGIDFEAEYDACEELPRLVSLEGGVKGNVVPGKAYAIVEGMDYTVMENAVGTVELETGIHFLLETAGVGQIRITAVGTGCHASHCEDGNNALTGLLTLLDRLPFASCRQIMLLHELAVLMPHGDVTGTNLGVAMKDEVSGHLSLAFTMLSVKQDKLSGHLDLRRPLCANEVNCMNVARSNMEAAGLRWTNVTEKLPHHVPKDAPFVKTLLRIYEDVTGRQGECLSRGGYTYVHGMKNGVAFGASMPETDNQMHGPDEFAVLEELIMSAKIFAQVIVELCL